jgi:DNA-binding transcriptional MocR family regulator
VTLDPGTDRPLYKQLADLIRTQIKNKDFAPGQRLPSQQDYVQEHGLSRDTVDRAMAVLRSEGLIRTDRTGSRVRSLPTPTTLLLQWGKVSARAPTEPERKKYGIEEGVPLLVVKHDGHHDEIYPADRTLIHISIATTACCMRCRAPLSLRCQREL